MRRITLWVMSTLSLLVLLFSYHTSRNASAIPTAAAAVVQSGSGASSNAGASRTTTSGSGSAGSGTDSGGDSTSGATSTTSNTKSTSGGTKTYTGTAVTDPYGQVQVQITVTDGKVTKSEAVQYPMDNGRDQEINSAAIPVLDSEGSTGKVSAINMISGATYTSNAYAQSLQSALDQANI